MSGGFRTVNTWAPLHNVQIKLQDAPLAQGVLGNWNQGRLHPFAKEGPAGAEEEIFHELLRERGGAANTSIFEVVVHGVPDLDPVETVVLVEAGILRRNYGVLEVRRNAV